MSTKEKTASGNWRSVSETLGKETNMSIQPQILEEGNLYELAHDDPRWEAPARRPRLRVTDLPDRAMFPITVVFDMDGQIIRTSSEIPNAWWNAGFAMRKGTETFVCRGNYVTDPQPSDPIGYVTVRLIDDVPCPIHDWCQGHDLREIEAYERGEGKFDPHIGRLTPFYTFRTGTKDEAHDEEASYTRIEYPEPDAPNLSVRFALDREYRWEQLADLARELRECADALERIPHPKPSLKRPAGVDDELRAIDD